MLTQDQLQVIYDPSTGIMRSRYTGHILNATRGNGYVAACNQYAHRLAWRLMTGEDPQDDIDHINGDRRDNRWCNLRLATRAQNLANAKAHKDSQSGIKGLVWSEERSKWCAETSYRGERHRKRFSDKEDAIKWLRETRERLHGAFRRD